jgi:hypothetical protein
MDISDSRKLKERTESLKEFGPKLLFHSLPNENVISKFKEYTGVMQFDDDVSKCVFWGKATNLMEGNIGSIDFVTYDYEYSVSRAGPGGYHKTFRGTAILLRSDQLVLPSFKLGSKFTWGWKGVRPGLPPYAEAGLKQCPTCGSLDVREGPMIEGGDFGDWCFYCKKSFNKMCEEMHEEKVHKLFALVSKDDLRGWSALASNTQLLLYLKSWVLAEKYQEFIEKALKIFQMFQSASQNLNEHA